VQKTNRDHADFGLLGSQVCLETKKLGGKKQIILPINSEGISHTKKKKFWRISKSKIKKPSIPRKNKMTPSNFLYHSLAYTLQHTSIQKAKIQKKKKKLSLTHLIKT
jgi:hypothetical protein